MLAGQGRAAARVEAELHMARLRRRACLWTALVAVLLSAAACTRTLAAPAPGSDGEPQVVVVATQPATPTAVSSATATAPAAATPTLSPIPSLTSSLTPTLTLSPTAAALPTSEASAPSSATAPAPLLSFLQRAVATRDARVAQEHSPLATPAGVLALLPTATPRPAKDAPPPAVESAPPPAELVADGVERTAHVPILMYHYLSAPPAGADIYRTDLSVTPELFGAHLDRIAAEGYTTISLYTLAAHLLQGAPLPDKPVVITFDDGYVDNYTNAFPLLRERGMTATFFVLTDFLDEQREGYMTWEMARAMLAGGMSIESHGRNHVSLRGKDDDYLIWQALGSLETIQHELGVRPRFVSYPAGEYDQRTLDIFKSANFWAGMTTVQGATQSSDRLFEMVRVRIRATTTSDQLAILLANDW